MRGKLILADGTEFYGTLLGELAGAGEVVFNTGMTGYQEVLTDPSYCGQIVTMTYPLIGNYGVSSQFDQAPRSHVRGVVISDLCRTPSNWRSETTLAAYLAERQIPCLYDVDTRAVTKVLRVKGAMGGVIAPADAEYEDVARLYAQARIRNLVEEVTTEAVYRLGGSGPRVVAVDYGVKRNIITALAQAGCEVIVVPADMPADGILALNPAGVFLSNGPGDPKALPGSITTIKDLIGRIPIFGICLGHQLLTLALGGDTYKLKFGHRGSNHPVKDLQTGRVYITSQNHGYAVDESSLRGKEIVITHRAVNDGTVEGIRHKTLPVFSVQYHPEAAPGPADSAYLFHQFIAMLKGEIYAENTKLA